MMTARALLGIGMDREARMKDAGWLSQAMAKEAV